MNENHKGDTEVRHEFVRMTVQMEPPAPPPPPGFTSPFKTLEEWLFCLCDTDKPEKTISELQFCLIESSADYLFSLDVFNKYDIEKDVIAYRIDYKPSHRFFPLPKEEFKNLSQQQVRERVLGQLKELMKTAKFQNSFMSKANSIKINFSDGGWQKLK